MEETDRLSVQGQHLLKVGDITDCAVVKEGGDHEIHQTDQKHFTGLDAEAESDHNCGEQTDQKTVTSKSVQGEEERTLGGPKFSPPVYIQRYMLVQKILHENAIDSVVDFGSAELKIFRWLKDVGSPRHIFLVDIDAQVLKSNMRSIKPLTLDYVFPPSSPLTVTVLAGSAGDLDRRVIACQAATLIEIIEHLEPDMFEQVTNCVFGRLRPTLVVVTTPNADFNILFPNFTGFRHWDHKFEWTRAEFQVWCNEVCVRHGYTVRFTGSGDPPPEMSHVGHCSQAAIFTEALGKAGEKTDQEVYDLVHEVVYPVDDRTPAEQLASEVGYVVNCCCLEERYVCEDKSVATIPMLDIVETVMIRQRKQQWSHDDIVNYLQEKHTLTVTGEAIVICLNHDSSSQTGSSSDCEEEEACLPEENSLVIEEEKWD